MNEEKLDVVIIGGGPAGISAAVWCADLGLSAVVLERKDLLYGQLRWIRNPIDNYPGISARDGEELIARLERTAAKWGIRTETGTRVESVDCTAKVVRIDGGRVLNARAIFVATGVRRRELGIPGEREFVGKGVMKSGSGERETVKGDRVIVVGGGDAAAENALILAEHAERVHLVHRRAELAARPEFLRAVEAHPRIEIHYEAEAVEIGGDARVRSVDVRSLRDGATARIPAEHFIARVGVAPNTELVASQLDTDPRGYIVTDALARTSAPAVFAVGDAANPVSPTIPTAVGTGAAAAKAAFALLTAMESV